MKKNNLKIIFLISITALGFISGTLFNKDPSESLTLILLFYFTFGCAAMAITAIIILRKVRMEGKKEGYIEGIEDTMAAIDGLSKEEKEHCNGD